MTSIKILLEVLEITISLTFLTLFNNSVSLTFTKPDGVRKRVKPPVRWKDAVEQDLRTVGIRGWKNIGADGGA
jgi:hypothetical protein